ncbi:hypothetical protein M413DRAFT_188252 [Hebeloma cylindrosporum]|uniref:Uncharacterized protein n=1 Tax=Hebeloma cylindrosporum TaxID=76867 RepID=A0A0C3BTF1_HEBCY|nr:hypothetical protein M413DRAFT_188252 [Hebeloma cylindrosporum h7]
MRYSLLISSLIATLTAFGVNATPHTHTPIRRFSLTGTPTQNENLTEAAAYARSLTRRRPTRRATAERRQVSDTPNIDIDIGLSVSNLATGSPVGNLVLGGSGLSLSAEGGANLLTSVNALWESRPERRILVPGLNPDYPYLGLVQFSAVSGLALGPGLSNGLLLTGVASPGTAPGATPAYLPNLGNPTVPFNGGETDIWTIDYITGRITPQWINPDGGTPITYLVSDGTRIAATGDIAAFNNANGLGWFPITLSYSLMEP